MPAFDGRLRKRMLAGFYRAAQRLCTCDVTHLFVLRESELRALALDGEATFEFLSPDAVAVLAVDPANELEEDLPARMQAGLDRCYAAFLRGRLAAYIWLASGSIEAEYNRGRTMRSGVPISFPADTAFVYKAFTRTEYRGRRLYASLLTRAMQELASEGVTYLATTADWTNEAALATCRRLGFHDLGKIGRYACLGLTFTTTPPAAPAWCIRIGSQALVDARIATALSFSPNSEFEVEHVPVSC